MMMIVSTLYAKHCFKFLIHIGPSNPHNNPRVQMKEQRHREDKWPASGHKLVKTGFEPCNLDWKSLSIITRLNVSH